MDTQWFKDKLRLAGLTHADVAEALRRDRAVVSRVLNGKQDMKPAQAEAIATLLDVPLSEVLAAAGLFSEETVATTPKGFSEGDAIPYVASKAGSGVQDSIVASLKANRPGVDVWRVATKAMSLAGFMLDDFLLVDGREGVRFLDGDVVIAQVYDWNAGAATTVLRRFQTPYLTPQSADGVERIIHVVDNRNVVIRGKVIASWRV